MRASPEQSRNTALPESVFICSGRQYEFAWTLWVRIVGNLKYLNDTV